MQTIEVALGERAYPIHVGQGLLHRSDLLLPLLRPFLRQPKVAVVSNTTIAPLYLDSLLVTLENAGISAVKIVLPDGEAHKNWTSLHTIFDTLLSHACERATTLIALGGGVIGDMTGFAAACYQRGVPFIQIPTTLLAQVDSSVGGKTAINHPQGKNMIGAFYQPKLVIIDTDCLQTLPDRELAAGLAEVIKYGLIRDLNFLEWLEDHLDELLARVPQALTEAILRSCQNKAAVVVADEHENAERALLNLGHTFGHAIETGMGYGTWLHGEAVAVGTLMAAELSAHLGWITELDVRRIERIFKRAGLPIYAPSLGAQRYLELMQHDKKVADGKLRLVLLKGIGHAVLDASATNVEITQAINARSR